MPTISIEPDVLTGVQYSYVSDYATDLWEAGGRSNVYSMIGDSLFSMGVETDTPWSDAGARQVFIEFDTSDIPEGSTITSATLVLSWGDWQLYNSPNAILEAYGHDWGATLDASAYRTYDQLEALYTTSNLWGSLAASSVENMGGDPSPGYMVGTAAFRAGISIGGVTRLVVVEQHSRTAPPSDIGDGYWPLLVGPTDATAAYRPHLIVEYEEAGAGQDEEGGSTATVEVDGSGAGSAVEATSGGSAATVEATPTGAGAGAEAASGGAEATVDITTSGSGAATEAASGGSTAGVTVTATGAGWSDDQQSESGGSTATIDVSARGGGTASETLAGGSRASTRVSAVGAGVAADVASGGSRAPVVVRATGAGTHDDQQHSSGGSTAVVSTTASGAGQAVESAAGGASAAVVITASGGGQSSLHQHEYGGSIASVVITASGGAHDIVGVRGLVAPLRRRRGLRARPRARSPTR